jgi:8-oxo-dGTP pyrophosphatase MutT (NUDIX family)
MADRIRQAATIVATRRGADGPEVLVVERSAESRFLPGYVAFPGGAVDPDDEEHARRWFGSPADAARAAALRELLEETGIAVTGAGAVAAAGLAAVDADPPDAASMREIAHWIAPEDVPVRFDARYFAVELPLDVDPVPDGGETADAWWISPRALLDGWKAGARKLYWPTWLTVSELAGCTTVEALLALQLEPREPDDDEVASMPRSVFWDR